MIPEIVQKAGQSFGEHACYVTPQGWELSYEQLDKFSDEAAAGLAAKGVTEGSVAGFFLPSTVDYVVAYVAMAKLGAVTGAANPRFGDTERQSVLETLQPDVVLGTGATLDGLNLGVDSQPRAVEVTVADHAGAILAGLRQTNEAPAALAPDPERAAAICFTSGSTGEPKGALYRNKQLEAILQLDTGGSWGGGAHNTAPTAFAHVGYMTKMPWILASGATTHLQEKWRAEATLELIHRYKMTAVTGVPPQIALMLRVPDLNRFDFSSVGAIVTGGGPASPALVAAARERFGCGYSIRYSSTESGGVGLGTALDGDLEETLHTVGSPRPGVQAEIRNAEGKRVADGDVGELWLTSPAVMDSYWNNPAETAETLVNGWLRTGDLAHVDDRGFYRLAGRVKEMFIRGGYNVYPMEVESVLCAHPLVADIALVPRPDEVMGEIGVAVVVPSDPANPPELADLCAFGANELAKFKLPERLRVVEALPLNASHKVDRRTLAAVEVAEVR